MSQGRRDSVPSYCLHKDSGQAYVTLASKVHYLGVYDTPASRGKYDKLITEWLAAGRPKRLSKAHDFSVAEICDQYWQFAKQYYRLNGKVTGELHPLKTVIRIL